ncbi:MAG: hypothetical protein LBQ42_06610 [Synergistaceae bacterium]|jgi:hypothetical protein|nr:hypothetical protein [Synergistaceae bacterium]
MKNRFVKKLVLCFAIAGAASFAFFPGESAADAPKELTEVTGTLEGIDSTTTPNVITLKVDEVLASGPLERYCSFFDEWEREIPREIFARRYIRRPVTVSMIKDSGEILSCRPEP